MSDRMTNSEREGREECLEALYRLERSQQSGTWQSLRNNPDLSGVDISSTLLELVAKGDVRLNGDEIALMASGRLTGKRIFRRHELAERFFRLLGVKHDRAHREACRIEHVMSLPGEHLDGLSERDELSLIVEMLGQGAVPLTQGRAGAAYRLGMVCGGRHARRKLEDLGVSRGAEIVLTSSNPVGPVEIVVRGSRLAIGRGIASKLLVIPESPGTPFDTGDGERRRRHGHGLRRHARLS